MTRFWLLRSLGSKMTAEPGQQDGGEAGGGRTGTIHVGTPPENQRAQPPMASLPSCCPDLAANRGPIGVQ